MQCVFLFGLEVVVLTRIPRFRRFILLGCGLESVGTVACNAGSSISNAASYFVADPHVDPRGVADSHGYTGPDGIANAVAGVGSVLQPCVACVFWNR